MTTWPLKHTIKSLSEYQFIVFQILEEWKKETGNSGTPFLWFRGQTKDRPLLPGVLRELENPNTGKKCGYHEYKILTTFTSIYRNYTEERFQVKSSEFYSFMQHYGVPTRLLDWTENPLFALYFAVINGRYDAEGDRIVWIMNPGAINQLTTQKKSYAPVVSDIPLVQARMKMVGYIKDNGEVIDEFWKNEAEFKGALENKHLKLPMAFYPVSAGNIRIATQKGSFTIHGTDRGPIESFFKDPKIQAYLIKIKVDKQFITSIREELRIMGVTPRSVCPDIKGFASELSGPYYMK